MATDDIISSDDLEFINRAEGLQKAFGKLRKAKALILEARADIATVLGKAGPSKPGPKAKGKNGTVHIEFGVDMPNELTVNEKAVLTLIRRGVSKMPAIIEQTKLPAWAAKRAAKSLRGRKLIKLEGHGASSVWKAK